MTPSQIRKEVIETLARTSHNPLGFVKWAFPWGKAGSALEGETGPDAWQAEILEYIGEEMRAGRRKVRVSVSSGKGIGKSALMAWLVCWSQMTREHCRGVVTANTETQLRTKTWAEMAKWHGLLLPPLKTMFKLEASSLHSTDAGADRTWRIDAIPNSEKNPEAFAGLHNKGSRIFVGFDEGSAIADTIYETTDGIMSDMDTEVIWVVFGNPTRNSGRFREGVEGRFRSMWHSKKIDNRTVKIVDKDEQNKLVEAYGEDHDYIRMMVRGEFPRASDAQFIGTDIVKAARRREPGYIASDPIIFGLDIGRSPTGDPSVLAIRRGRDARTFPWKHMLGWSLMQVAAFVAEQVLLWRPEAVFVDVTGMGQGVVDRLVQLNLPTLVIGVSFGKEAGLTEVTLSGNLSIRVYDKAAAMWCLMRDWLDVGSIPDEEDLESDLTGRLYGYDDNMGIRLERKEDMKKRKLASPDNGDALSLTFAYPVQPRQVQGYETRRAAPAYDIHADLG